MRKNVWLVVLLVALGYGGYWLLVRDNSTEDCTTPGVCELHLVPYATETIPVTYGYRGHSLTRPTEAQREWWVKYRAAWETDFAFTHLAYGGGGCVVRPYTHAKVSYCPECRKADEAWHAKHGQYPSN